MIDKEEALKHGLHLIGERAKIEGSLSVEGPVFLHDCVIVGPVTIGYQTYVGDFTHVAQNTSIGRYCSIGNLCTIGATHHPADWLSTHPFQFLGMIGSEVKTLPWRWANTRIGNDVWMGANVVVRGGVCVGDGAILGSGAIVTKDVPPYAVMVGNPARVLRMRFPQRIVYDLCALKWWELLPSLIQDLPFDRIEECLARLRELRAAVGQFRPENPPKE